MTTKTLARIFGQDAEDLRWYFQDSEAAASGMHAIPIEPGTGGRDEDADAESEMRKECLRATTCHNRPQDSCLTVA